MILADSWAARAAARGDRRVNRGSRGRGWQTSIILTFVWIPVYQASSVDVILAPDELLDRKLIEVVHRTHRFNDRRQGHLVLPYRVLGALTVLIATVGLFALREEPRPHDPGMIGMRDRPSS